MQKNKLNVWGRKKKKSVHLERAWACRNEFKGNVEKNESLNYKNA